MASYFQQVILIALILSIAVPISIGHREKSKYKSDWDDDWEAESDWDIDDPEIENDDRDDSAIGRYLRDLCSDTKKSKQCWKIIKPEINKFTDTDSRNVAGVVIELAIEKSDEISDKLDQLHQDSGDDSLKAKYVSCWRNYNNAHRNLDIVKWNLDSDDYRRVKDSVKDVKKELKRCKHEFGKKSEDPTHIGDRNREFGRYLDIVKTAAMRFLKEREGDNARKH